MPVIFPPPTPYMLCLSFTISPVWPSYVLRTYFWCLTVHFFHHMRGPQFSMVYSTYGF